MVLWCEFKSFQKKKKKKKKKKKVNQNRKINKVDGGSNQTL